MGTKLIDGARYRGHHFYNTKMVEGTLVPKGEIEHEGPRERTLLKDNGIGHYVDPRSLVPVEEEPAQTVRARVLDEAKRITATDRNSSYGEPEDNFQRIADFWNTFLGPKLKEGSKITPGDTAALMIMVKLAREMNAPKEDNKVDISGYAACWAEVDDRG